MGYTCLPTAQDADGLVGIIFNKTEEQIRTNQQTVVDTLHKILGGKAGHSVCVEAVKALPENK